MIKFFRRIRYDLMGNPSSAKASAGTKTGTSAEVSAKAGRYLKYAIGEIVLVVIGILIALSINNWNQKRIVKNQISEYLTSLVADLNSDIVEYELNIKEFERGLENNSRILINDDYKKLEADSIVQLIMRFWNLNRISDQTFQKIKNTGLQEILGTVEINKAVNDYYNISISHYDYLINWDKESTERDGLFWLYNDHYESGLPFLLKSSSIPYRDSSAKRKEELIKLTESTLGRNYLRNAVARSEYGIYLVRDIKSKAENLVQLIEKEIGNK